MGNGAACYDQSIYLYNNDGMSWTMWAYKTDLASNGWGWYDPIRSLADAKYFFRFIGHNFQRLAAVEDDDNNIRREFIGRFVSSK